MSRIRVQNFGPLKNNTQWIELGKVTLLIGNQGSGKSTVAKLISTFKWMEKALNREALSYSRAVCRVVPAALGDNIGDMAALAVASNIMGGR